MKNKFNIDQKVICVIDVKKDLQSGLPIFYVGKIETCIITRTAIPLYNISRPICFAGPRYLENVEEKYIFSTEEEAVLYMRQEVDSIINSIEKSVAFHVSDLKHQLKTYRD